MNYSERIKAAFSFPPLAAPSRPLWALTVCVAMFLPVVAWAQAAPTASYGCGFLAPGTASCSTISGGTVFLYWSSTNATACAIDGAPVGLSNGANSFSSLPITATTQSALVCTGPGGSASKTVTLGVAPLVYADTFPGADASEKINAAIQSLPSSTGGTVDATRFSGTQVLSNILRLDRPVYLLLASTVFEFRGTSSAYHPESDISARNVIRLSSPGATVGGVSQTGTIVRVLPTYIYNGVGMATSGTRVTNLTIEGPGQRAVPSLGINSANATHVEISHATIKNWGSHGINTGNDSSHWLVRNSIIENNHDDGILLARRTAFTTVMANVFRNNGAIGIDINGSSNRVLGNSVIHNGYIYGPSGVDGWGILITPTVGAHAQDNLVDGNVVEASAMQNIIIRGVDGLVTSRNVVIRNIVSGATLAAGDGIAIDGTGGGTIIDNTITNNTVRNNGRFGILIDGTGATTVAGNTVSTNFVEANRLEGIAVVAPVFTSLATNNIVTGNTIVDRPDMHLEVWANTNSLVSGNILKSNSIRRLELNGDGNGDLLAYHAAGGQWAALIVAAAGGFTINGGVWSPGLSVQPGDFNSDALTDLFLFNTATGQWAVMLNTGAGTFATQAAGIWPTSFQRFVVDLDGDFIDDVFLWDSAGGTWLKCLFSGTAFSCESGFWSAGWEVYPARLKAGGPRDFFLINRSTGQWFTVLNSGAAGFTYPQSGFWSTDVQIHPGDYSGDGLTDFLTYRPATGLWSVARSGAGFTYTSGFFSTGWSIHPVDLDADGRTDLFMHNQATGQWFQLRANASGGFVVAGSGFWVLGLTVTVSDFDGDGRGDLLLYNPASGTWFRAQNGDAGAFSYTGGVWSPNLTIVTRKPN